MINELKYDRTHENGPDGETALLIGLRTLNN